MTFSHCVCRHGEQSCGRISPQLWAMGNAAMESPPWKLGSRFRVWGRFLGVISLGHSTSAAGWKPRTAQPDLPPEPQLPATGSERLQLSELEVLSASWASSKRVLQRVKQSAGRVTILERRKRTGQVSHSLLLSADLHCSGIHRVRAGPCQDKGFPGPSPGLYQLLGCGWRERLLPQQHQPPRSETPAQNLLREPTVVLPPEGYQGNFWGTAYRGCLSH